MTYEKASNGAAIVDLVVGINNLLLALRNFSLAIALLFIIIGGIKYSTSSGDPEKAASARQTITWAIVAIILALTIWIIIFLLAEMIGIKPLQDGSGLTIPKPEDLFNLGKLEDPDYITK